MNEKYMHEYEDFMLKTFRNSGDDTEEPPGYVSFVAVREICEFSLRLSWYVNFIDRFHEIEIMLPKSEIIACAGSESWGDKPHVFVKSDWLNSIYLRHNSIFALVDATNMKAAINSGSVTRQKLIWLRNLIDDIALKHSDMLFISMADNVILKTNWTVGRFGSSVGYTYSPDNILEAIGEIADAFHEVLEMDVYAIVTQGSNEYYEDPLYYQKLDNHVSLNSLGAPFANLVFIEQQVRTKGKHEHGEHQLYLDSQFFHSLGISQSTSIDFTERKHSYDSKLKPNAAYYWCERSELELAQRE